MDEFLPPEPAAYEVDLGSFPDKASRYAWHDGHVRWALARQLRDLREARGWTRAEVARRAGVSVMTVWRIEARPDFWPGLSALIRIAEAFDVALECRFSTWGEWLEWQRYVEDGHVPPSFDQEVAAGR